MILIYSPQSSARLSYTTQVLSGLMPGAQLSITHSKDAVQQQGVACINYSDEPIEGTLWIKPAGLLWEDNIHPVIPEMGTWHSTPAIFPTGGDVTFDIFSAVFYLVSRYEEYTDTQRDVHGRYTAHQSFLFKNKLLHAPLVNWWTGKLRETVNQKFNLNLKPLPYSFVPTIDIDQAFYYRYKPFAWNVLGGLKQLAKGQWTMAARRAAVTLGFSADPNDTFALMEEMHKAVHTKPIYFFHTGLQQVPFDPQPLHFKKNVLQLIRHVSDHNTVGIHPSYRSFNNKDIILAEIMRLEEITGKKITQSRQHFLRFSLPQTYRLLTECGITDDYSMGYADYAGHRAGIAAPFKWFDLEKNTETGLTIHPFALMDVTWKNYMKTGPEWAFDQIKHLYEMVRQQGGTFITLWHNESLSEHGEWKGWSSVYQKLLSTCIKK